MAEWLLYGFLGLVVCSFCGLGYFTIWRLTDETHRDVKQSKRGLLRAVEVFNAVKKIIYALDQRLRELETEIKLQKNDSARLVEWLDKERAQRDVQYTEIIKSLKVTERESRIIELSERLKLITLKK